ncbi:MAG: PilX N-terminal domain-containing pilus assembly protein [Candidatus Edwardsbacteria bacterium]
MKKIQKNERGIALVVALLILLIISLLAAGLMVTTTTEIRIAGNQLRDLQSLSVAEAGINEITQRMSLDETDQFYIGDVTPRRPRWATKIFLSSDTSGWSGDTIHRRSVQIVNSVSPLLLYSNKSRTDGSPNNVLIVHYKTKLDSIYFFNSSNNSQFCADANYSGPYYPVLVVEACGRVGNAQRRLYVEVTKRPVSVNSQAGIASGTNINATGNLSVCGHNHRDVFPIETNVKVGHDQGAARGCYDFPSDSGHIPILPDSHLFTTSPPPDAECTNVGCMPGITTTVGHTINSSGSYEYHGNPDSISGGLTECYDIWKVLGYNTEDEMNLNSGIVWTEHPGGTVSSGTLAGFIRVTDNNLKLTGGTNHHGVIWVRKTAAGPANVKLELQSVSFRGLLYSDDDLQLTSNAKVLGGLVAKGKFTATIQPASGGAEIFYSKKAIEKEVQKGLGAFIVLSWREVEQ